MQNSCEQAGWGSKKADLSRSQPQYVFWDPFSSFLTQDSTWTDATAWEMDDCCQEDESEPGKRSWTTLATPAAAPHHQGLPGDVQQAGAGGSHQPSAAA